MVNWPALLKYKGDPELIFIADGAHWQRDYSAQQERYVCGDVLIDSQGAVFSLSTPQTNVAAYHLELPTLTAWIQQHYSAQGQCCISKLQFDSVAAAIAALRQ